ncbi:hypothetical protein [Acinetobacter populi]|uniref:Uncharacterized protein n=1 Tax=Acinetobacter populi TaxID=1582270 RepID=A0A1Z9YY28_9GAMM|nr:hypothetical protein [Acinetobacter populi]OUY07119.1 hypothetical protein CAP51_10555 [Acinetobacter populi]
MKKNILFVISGLILSSSVFANDKTSCLGGKPAPKDFNFTDMTFICAGVEQDGRMTWSDIQKKGYRVTKIELDHRVVVILIEK